MSFSMVSPEKRFLKPSATGLTCNPGSPLKTIFELSRPGSETQFEQHLPKSPSIVLSRRWVLFLFFGKVDLRLQFEVILEQLLKHGLFHSLGLLFFMLALCLEGGPQLELFGRVSLGALGLPHPQSVVALQSRRSGVLHRPGGTQGTAL